MQSNLCTFQRRVNRFNLRQRKIRKSGGGKVEEEEEEEQEEEKERGWLGWVWVLKPQQSSVREGP